MILIESVQGSISLLTADGSRQEVHAGDSIPDDAILVADGDAQINWSNDQEKPALL
jgi:hypothetical protein